MVRCSAADGRKADLNCSAFAFSVCNPSACVPNADINNSREPIKFRDAAALSESIPVRPLFPCVTINYESVVR